MEHKKLLGCFTLFSIFLCLNQSAEGWLGKSYKEKKALKKIEKEANSYSSDQVEKAFAILGETIDYSNKLSVNIEKTQADIKSKIDSINTFIQSKLQASDKVAFNRVSKPLIKLVSYDKKRKMLNVSEELKQLNDVKATLTVFASVYFEKAANYRNELGEILTLNGIENSKQFQKEKKAIQKLIAKYSKNMIVEAYKAVVASINEIGVCKDNIVQLNESITAELSQLINHIETNLRDTDLDAYNSIKKFVENLKSEKADYDQITNLLKKINFELARRKVGYVNVATRNGYGDKLVNQQHTHQAKINRIGTTSVSEIQKRNNVKSQADYEEPTALTTEDITTEQTTSEEPTAENTTETKKVSETKNQTSLASHVGVGAPENVPPSQVEQPAVLVAGNPPPPPPLRIDSNGKPAAPVAGNPPPPPPLRIDGNGKPTAPVAGNPPPPPPLRIDGNGKPAAPEVQPIAPVVQQEPTPTAQLQFNMKEERAKKTESLHEVISDETYLNTLIQKAPDLLVERMSYTTKADLLNIPAKVYKDLIAKLTPAGVKNSLRPASLPHGQVGKPASGARIITIYAMYKVLGESYKNTAQSLISTYGTGKNMVQGLTKTFNRAGMATFENDMRLAEHAPDNTFDSSSDKTWAISDTEEREVWKLKAKQVSSQASTMNKPSVGTGKVWKKKQVDTSGMDFSDILKKGMAERGIEKIQ